MVILKLLQPLLALVGIGVTIFGIVSFFQGEWLRMILSIGAFMALSFIWYPINQAVVAGEARRFSLNGF